MEVSSGELHRQTMMHDGVERNYYFRLPANFKSSESLPVMFVLHGGGKSGGKETAERWDFSELSDRERFILVFPNGTNNQWNDGRGATYRDRNRDLKDVDDVGFLSALIDKVVKDFHADATRVYMTGGSNGGMMTHRMGIEATHKLAAIAPMISNIPVKLANSKTKPGKPIPVLIVNGTKDPMVPYDGGHVVVFRRQLGKVLSTNASIDYWKSVNGVRGQPMKRMLPNAQPDDECEVEVLSYGVAAKGEARMQKKPTLKRMNKKSRNAAASSASTTDASSNKSKSAATNSTRTKKGPASCPIVHYKIVGGGHTIPGMNARVGRAATRILGNHCRDFRAADVVWNFCKQFKSK